MAVTKKVKKPKDKDFRKNPQSGYPEKNPKSKKDAAQKRPGTKLGK